MSVNPIINGDFDRKTRVYGVKNLCTSAAIYERKLRQADYEEEIPKKIFSQSETFPSIKIREQIDLLRIAKQKHTKTYVHVNGIQYKVH